MLIDVTYSYRMKYKYDFDLIKNYKNLVVKIRFKTIFSKFKKTICLTLVDNICSDRELEEFFEAYNDESIKRLVEDRIRNELRYSIRKETTSRTIKRLNRNSKNIAKMSCEI